MKAKELINILSTVDPDSEVVTGTWNGEVNTYTVVDRALVAPYDSIYADFFGTPGTFDDRLLAIRSKEVVYLGSTFEKQLGNDN